MKKTKSSEKGITLIALGIMIILLLIMAGVATSNMDESNGIITNAENIKDYVESKNSINKSEESKTNSDAISYIIK